MKITLQPRTTETVAVYFEKAQHPAIRQMLPQKAKTVEEALTDFANTQLPGAASYGRTIYADARYVGDVWCYAIDRENIPNAMLSYCVFELDTWGKGTATKAVQLFLEDVQQRYALCSIGAFTYAENIASIRVLEKNGFCLLEEFEENGVFSRYYQRSFPG